MANVVWFGDKEVKTATISLSTNFVNVQAGYVSVIHYFFEKSLHVQHITKTIFLYTVKYQFIYRVILVFATALIETCSLGIS